MVKLSTPKTEVPYWDEGNKNMFPWYKKGRWKRILRKRWIKKQFKDADK